MTLGDKGRIRAPYQHMPFHLETSRTTGNPMDETQRYTDPKDNGKYRRQSLFIICVLVPLIVAGWAYVVTR